MGRADLHIHTTHSDGMMDVPALLAHAADWTTLNVIAIADHDQVRGAPRPAAPSDTSGAARATRV